MSGSSVWIKSNSVGSAAVLMASGKIEVDTVHAINTVAAISYLQLFDAAEASSVSVGTTVPDFVLSVASSGVATQDFAKGQVFQNGVVVASTTTNVGNTQALQHVRLAIR